MAAAIATLGGVRQIFHFDAYGNAIGFNPAQAATTYLYSGEQFDSRIGQQYLRARYYDPATGRFNRLDDFTGNMRDPQSLHKYLYTHADPVNGIDPTGESLLGGVTLGSAIRGTLIAMNVGSFVYSAVQTIHHGIGIIISLLNGDFWDFLGHTILAGVNGIGALLSWTGLKAALATTPAQIMQMLNSVRAAFNGGSRGLAFAGAGSLAMESVLAIPIVAEWVVTVAAGPALSAFLAMSNVPLENHHKIPYGNSSFDFQNHDLVKTAGRNLEEDSRNQMLLANHRGRHAKTYLQQIKEFLDDAWASLTGTTPNPSQTQASSVLDDVMDDVEKGIIDKTLKPYKSKDVWKP